MKFFTEVVPGKKNSELTPTELNAKAEMLNTLVKEMDAIIDAKVEGRKTKVQEDLSTQRRVMNQQKEVSAFWSAIKNPVKVFTKELALIPRGNAEALDFYNKGTFTAFQDKLEKSWIDIYRVQVDVDKIMAPVSLLMEQKGFGNNKGKIELEVTSIGGKKKTIKLGIADRSRIYLAKLDPETWKASQTSCWKLGRKKFMLSEEGYNKIDDISDEYEWQTVRDSLIKNVGINSVPVVLVKELQKDGTLILEHEHDGRDLELSEANKVFEQINELWPGIVTGKQQEHYLSLHF